MELVYILQNRVEKGFVYFSDRLYSETFCFLHRGAQISRFFSVHVKLAFLYLTLESILNWCIYSKAEQNKTQYIFSNGLYSDHFLLTLGCLDNIQIFFDSRKIRILVFYIREHIELVYILQNSVEKGIVNFFSQIILRAILVLTLGCLDNIQIFLIRVKLEFLYFK